MADIDKGILPSCSKAQDSEAVHKPWFVQSLYDPCVYAAFAAPS